MKCTKKYCIGYLSKKEQYATKVLPVISPKIY